ncbi:MAG: hypothetical protein MK098_13690 [Marinovum sp.]|nr:hypothetical protein [Marinovum sp.]
MTVFNITKSANADHWIAPDLSDHLLALGKNLATLTAETLDALGEDEINATAWITYIWQENPCV